MTSVTINLESIIQAHMPGLKAAKAGALVDAAACCFMQNQHLSGIEVEVNCTPAPNHKVNVNWDAQLTPDMERTWYDTDEAAEDGASALAILLAYELKDHIVVSRARKKTGFDYFLCHKDELANVQRGPNSLFNYTKRLEVSGLFCQPASSVKARLQTKIVQTAKYDSDWDVPALIGIVEFGKPDMHLLERAGK